ncbi:type III-B CRISPR module RAMP protein Cmr1 [Fervidobacterium thailandense]|uniref:CRISPR type III-associated protein domain-containing protein n=1 Tax=Fervidobacterium thailandense TaxID=1008305 RepID=A0A1E3G394_9BACT|nr:type III-B CRISPR module RAMP protein Cmr1 [Fervidobacterium thailandense]ODN30766.1 hypothetical protein A4H02_04365 [Fervidobacterium thailandense]
MVQETVTCRVVTPIFSRSEELADQTDRLYEFELRPQSVRGVLHFWFRAVAPRVINICELDLSKLPSDLAKEFKDEKFKGLKYLEMLVFGSQNRKGPFGLFIQWREEDTEPIGRFGVDKKGKTVLNFSPIIGKDASYPLYGLYSTKENEKFITKFLKPGAEFKIHVFSNDSVTYEVVLSLLKLVSTISGFGAKTTKGFGEFEIVKPIFNRSQFINANNFEQLIKEVEGKIRKFIEEKDLYKALKLERTPSDLVEFPSLLPGKYEILTVPVQGQSLNEVFTKLYGMRVERNGDKTRIVRNWYRELKYRLRFVGKNKTGDAVKDLVNCINGQAKEADIGPAIVGLPIVYQNLRKAGARADRITVFPSVETTEPDVSAKRKTSVLRIIISQIQRTYQVSCLLLDSPVTQRGELEHSERNARFRLKLTLTHADLKDVLRKLNQSYHQRMRS